MLSLSSAKDASERRYLLFLLKTRDRAQSGFHKHCCSSAPPSSPRPASFAAPHPSSSPRSLVRLSLSRSSARSHYTAMSNNPYTQPQQPQSAAEAPPPYPGRAPQTADGHLTAPAAAGSTAGQDSDYSSDDEGNHLRPEQRRSMEDDLRGEFRSPRRWLLAESERELTGDGQSCPRDGGASLIPLRSIPSTSILW